MVDRFLRFTEYLGIPAVYSFTLDLPTFERETLLSGQKPLLLQLGSSGTKKNWSTQGYQDLALHYAQQGRPVILTGGPETFKLAQQLTLQHPSIISRVQTKVVKICKALVLFY